MTARRQEVVPSRDRRLQAPVAEILEPRLLYSADALGPLAGLLPDETLSSEWDPADYVAAQPADASDSGGALAIIDERVPDRDRLLELLDEAGVRSVVIASDADGVDAIAAALDASDELQTLHVFGHGSEGQMSLGSRVLDAATLAAEADSLSAWSAAFVDGGDLLLYGCDTGAGDAGLALVQNLSKLTGLDVAASDDLTGSAALGGDWDLEVRAGQVSSHALAVGETLQGWSGKLETLEVTRLTDNFEDFDLTVEQFLRMDIADRSLRDATNAINNSGGDHTIVLGSGTFELTIPDDPATSEQKFKSGDLDIRASMTIVGQSDGSTTIYQALDDRVIEIGAEVPGQIFVELQYVTVQGGEKSGQGGGIMVRNEAEVTLRSSVIDGNLAKTTGGGVGVAPDAELFVVDSAFTRNTAEGGGGGGIHSEGLVILSNVVFEAGNLAELDGGGIWSSGTLDIERSRFLSNHSQERGGAIHTSGTAVIRDSLFDDNSARDNGGGVHNVGDLIVQRSLFQNNVSSGDDSDEIIAGGGGAVSVHGRGVTSISDAMFQQNSAPSSHGGAIDVHSDDVVLDRVTFAGNTAIEGGAMNIAADGVSLINATFSSNEASSKGGAIRIDGDVTINHATFVNNSDDLEGGALWVESGVVTVSNSLFESNLSNAPTSGSIGGAIVSGGYNLFDTAEHIVFANGRQQTDIVADGPFVDALADHGGHVPTHAPIAEGAAVNRGGQPFESEDARGEMRDEIPDIGAHELDLDGEVHYWSDGLGNIWRSNAALEFHQLMVSGLPTGSHAPTDLEVSMEYGRVFWIDGSDAAMASMRLDGSGMSRIPLNDRTITAIAVDPSGRRHFMAATGSSTIIIPFDSENPDRSGRVFEGAEYGIVDPRDLAFDRATDRLYWTEGDLGDGTPGVRWLALDGSDFGIAENWPDAIDPQALVFDSAGSRMFGSDAAAGGSVSMVGQFRGETITTALADANDISHGYISNSLLIATDSTGGFARIDEDMGTVTMLTAPVPVAAPAAVGSGVTSGFDPDPVAGGSATVEVRAERTVTIDNSMLAASDVQFMSAEQLSYSVVGDPTRGTLLIDGTPVQDLPVEERYFTQAEIDDPDFLIEYRHDGPPDAASDSFRVVLSDGVNPGLPARQVDIVVASNQPSEVVRPDPNPGVGEHVATQMDDQFIEVIDEDTEPEDLQFVITSQPSAGHLELRDPTGTVALSPDALTVAQLREGQLWYVQSGDGPDTSGDRFDYRIDHPDDGPEFSPTGSVTFAINNVNDQPVVATGTLTVAEGSESMLDSSVLSAEDDDTADTAAQLIYTVDAAPDGSQLRISGVTQAASGASFSQADVDGGLIVYVQGGGQPDPSTDSLELSLSDQGGSGEPMPVSVALNVEAFNDPPVVFAPTTASVPEHGERVLDETVVRVTDPDSAASDLVFTIDSEPMVGHLELRVPGAASATLQAGQTFTYADIQAGNLFYVQSIGGPDTAEDSFVYTLNDPGSPSHSVTQTLVLEIENSNDPSRLFVNELVADEERSVPITSAQLSFEDDDTGEASQDLSYTVTGAPAGSRVLVGGAEQVDFTQADVNAGRVEYVHGGGEPQAGVDALALTVLDSGGRQTELEMNISVQPFNDAPVVAPLPDASVPEHGERVLDESVLRVTDPDSAASDLVFTIDSEPTVGHLELRVAGGGSATLQAGQTFTYADIQAGNVFYVQSIDGPDTAQDSFTYTLNDSGSPARSASGELSLQIDNTDDPSRLSVAELVAHEERSVPITSAQLSFEDDDQDQAPQDLSYTVTGAPAGSRVLVGGAEQVDFTQADVNAGRVEYVHGGDESRPGTDAVTLDALDSGGRQTELEMSISVQPFNDAPVVAPLPDASVPEHGERVLDESVLRVTDPDSAASDLVFTIDSEPMVGHLELRVPAAASATLQTGQTFTYADVQAGTLFYVQSIDGPDTAADSFEYTLTDAGSPSYSVSETLTLEIQNIDDPSRVSMGGLVADEEQSVAITTDQLSFADDDQEQAPEDLSYTITGGPAGSRILVDGVEVTTFTQADVNGGKVRYAHGGAEPRPGEDALTVTALDSGGRSTELHMPVTVTQVNDRPVAEAGSVRVSEGGSYRLAAGLVPSGDLHASDPETLDPDLLRFEVLDLSEDAAVRMALSENGAGVNSFTASDLERGVFIVHDGSERHDPIDLTLSLSDADGATALQNATLLVQVDAVEEAPRMALPANPGVVEHELTVLDSRYIDISDVDTVDERLMIEVDSAPAVGALVRLDDDGRIVARDVQRFVNAELLAGRIGYLQDVDGPDTAGDRLAVTLTDMNGGSLPVEGTLLLTIENEPDAPRVSTSPLDVEESSAAIVDNATIAATDDDVADTAAALRFTIDELPGHGELMLADRILGEGATITQADVDAGRVSYRHDGSETLTDTVQLVLRDSDEQTVAVQIRIVVSPINDAPEVADVAAPLTLGGEQGPVAWTLPDALFVDADGDTLSYSMSVADGGSLPQWLRFDPATRTVELLDPAQALESLDVLLSVDDGRGGRASTAMTLLFDRYVEPELGAATQAPPVVETAGFTPLASPVVPLPTSVDPVVAPPAPAAPVQSALPATDDEPDAGFDSNVGEVDIRALLELSKVDMSTAAQTGGGTIIQKLAPAERAEADELVGDFDFSAFITNRDPAASREDALIDDALDRERDALQEQTMFAQAVLGGTVGLSAGLSVGYFLWLVRGGALLGSVLSGLPAWRFVDPLPVLASLDAGVGDEDQESLQTLVDGDSRARAA